MQPKTERLVSNSLTILVVLLIAISVVYSFYKYFVQKDYTVYYKAACDPAIEECLSEQCDTEDPRCKPSEDGLMYYKEISEEASVR